MYTQHSLQYWDLLDLKIFPTPRILFELTQAIIIDSVHTADNQLVAPLGLLHDPQHAWAEDIFWWI